VKRSAVRPAALSTLSQLAVDLPIVKRIKLIFIVRGPQISPLRFAPVEMTKGRVVVARKRGLGMSKLQIFPLRFASVEMTEGRVVVARKRGLGMGKPQISPLRFASVEMTKEREGVSRESGC
jgi:hypothetical protein